MPSANEFPYFFGSRVDMLRRAFGERRMTAAYAFYEVRPFQTLPIWASIAGAGTVPAIGVSGRYCAQQNSEDDCCMSHGNTSLWIRDESLLIPHLTGNE